MSDPSLLQALRGKPGSSMRISLELVLRWCGASCVSAGNTGALMVFVAPCAENAARYYWIVRPWSRPFRRRRVSPFGLIWVRMSIAVPSTSINLR